MRTTSNKNKFSKSKAIGFVGTLLIVCTILLAIPLVVPKIMGFRAYNILSGSMSNIYDIGTVVYLKEVPAETIRTGDVIGFCISETSENIAIHRVVEIDSEAKCFTTKGDMNSDIDSAVVQFTNIVGRAEFSLPYIGKITYKLDTYSGKMIMICILILAITCWVVSDRLKKNDKNTDDKILDKKD